MYWILICIQLRGIQQLRQILKVWVVLTQTPSQWKGRICWGWGFDRHSKQPPLHGGRQLRNWRQSCKRDFLHTLHWIRCVADEKSESFIPQSILLNAKPFYKVCYKVTFDLWRGDSMVWRFPTWYWLHTIRNGSS